MKNIKINNLTIYLILVLFLSGYLIIGLVIFIIVLIHELGHVFLLRIFNYKILDITIYPFGGITKVDKKINTNINKEIFIAFGGIIFQIFLFIVIYILPLRTYIKLIFYKYNFSIMIFNLLPIIPLDGYIIIKYLLNKYFSFKISYYLSTLISILFILIYICINVWYSLNNYLIITLFIYKIYESLKNYKYIYNRFLLERYINNIKFKKISTKTGNIDILKLETLQFFKEGNKIVNEREKLRKIFDNKAYF